MAELLVDVQLEVARERRGDRILVAERPRPLERGSGQRNRRPDDLVLGDQVLGPELGDARMQYEEPARLRVRRDDELELAPEAAARAGLQRLRQWSANAFMCGSQSPRAAPTRSSTSTSSGESETIAS